MGLAAGEALADSLGAAPADSLGSTLGESPGVSPGSSLGASLGAIALGEPCVGGSDCAAGVDVPPPWQAAITMIATMLRVSQDNQAGRRLILLGSSSLFVGHRVPDPGSLGSRTLAPLLLRFVSVNGA